VGGKAANLGRMLGAGLPVPGGFCVTTVAFRLWLEANRDAVLLLDRLDRLAPQVGPEIRETAAALRQMLAVWPVPQPMQDAIRAAAGQPTLRGAAAARATSRSWAVRSSATAEDLPGASFAGQHDSLLNVRGPEPLIEAVRRCWVSLYNERAVFYRLKNLVPHRSAAMAVIVQEMVPAEVSGVLFTANPVTGDTTRLIIEGAPGLGESLVSGRVNPERRTLDRQSLRAIEPAGPPRQCLTGPLTRRLGKLGLKAERLFGRPQDIEWAARDGRAFLLQSRPITALPPAPGHGPEPEVEVWTNANVMEALPDVVVPMAWSLLQVMFIEFIYPIMRRVGLDPDARPLVALIAGRAYLNARTLFELVERTGNLLPIDAIAAFGGLHGGLEKVIRPGPAPRRGFMNFRALWRLAKLGRWLLPGLVGQQRLIEQWIGRVSRELARTAPATLSDEELAGHPFGLLRLAVRTDGDRTTAAALWMAATAVGGSARLFDLAHKWLGDADRSLANRLLAGAQEMGSAENGLALLRLAAWARGHPELKQALLEPIPFAALGGALAGLPRGPEFIQRWRAFMEAHGHQARGGMDLFQPRWSEMPDFVLDNLRVYLRFAETSDPLVLQARQRIEREALLAQCRRRLRNPLKRWLFTFLVRISRRGLAQRENVKNEGVRLVAVVRRIALEAGRRLVERGALSQPDDVVFLRLEELGPALAAPPAFDVANVVAARKAEYARHKALSPPPVVIGRFDPDACQPAAAGAQPRTLQGLPVSPGLVTGKARVILQADEAERVQPGEILVAPYTDPGWTPYFLAAAGIVVDVGGLLSHGSVVAREYGLPAVVNVGLATKLIRTGQRIEVDGNRGTVTILEG
jgi:pyruvate,water dikinase